MHKPNRSIFRENALKHYMRGDEKTTLPRFVNLPTALLLWLLLGLLLLEAGLAWNEEVPTYVTAPGIVLNMDQGQQGKNAALALIFLEPSYVPSLRSGLPVQAQIGSSGLQVQSEIVQVEPGVSSPYLTCQQYQLGNNCALLVPQPSTVVVIRLEKLSAAMYAGSLLTARVKVGSQRIISLIPGVGDLVGR